jgi:hypothetical protein
MLVHSKVKEQFLSFQSNVILKSLTDLNKENDKLAIQIHKDLLGYMGDICLPNRVMLAQAILRKGFEYKLIRDEIYLLVIKQVTNNPRPESVAKGWQVMCMCVLTFAPSQELENFLLHYIIEMRDRGRGAVVDYAKYCLRTLEATLRSGDKNFLVPSVEEILAYNERPPILATIFLVDGNSVLENLALTPDLNVSKVIEMCAGWLGFKDPRVNTLGMFVYDLGETENSRLHEDPNSRPPYADLKRTPRPLRNEDFMGDAVVQMARQKRKFKFVLKRKIFLPKDNYRGDDPFFERMTYLQAEDDAIIQGNLEVAGQDDVVRSAAISVTVAFKEGVASTASDVGVGYVVDFIPPDWKNLKSAEKWRELVLQYRDSLVYMEPDDLQEGFLQIVRNCPMYGSHWFFVHKLEPLSVTGIPKAIQQLPQDILLAFNAEGMHIFTWSRRHLLSYPYSDISRWGGSAGQFSLILIDDTSSDSFELVLITAQTSDLSAIILDHIIATTAEEKLQG